MVGVTLGARIKEIRRDLRLKQSEFAPEVGVGTVQVSRWERDVSVPSLVRVQRIAAAGGYTLSEFFDGLDLETPRV